MKNTIVDVLVELDDGTEATALAKVEKEIGDTCVIRYLSATKKLYGNQQLYSYEKDIYTIDKSSISGFYDSINEEDAGMQKVTGGWIQVESDSEYVPSESEVVSDTDTDVTLTESDKDED